MTRFTVPDMSCAHCAGTIEKAIRTVDPAAKVSIDLVDQLVSVESTAPTDTLAAAMGKAGYEATTLPA